MNEGSDHSLGRLKNIVGPNTELGSSIGKIMNEINQANNMAFESFQKISTLIMDKAKEADRLANESIGGYETISTMTDDMTWH